MNEEIPKDVAAESGVDKVYDEKHNDPSADVILVSNDNVSFRVHSWYFKQKSGFVRDLMSLPPSDPFGIASIPVDELASHIRFFIDMVYSSNVAIIPVTYEDFKPLLKICQRMQSAEIQGTLWTGFSKTLSNVLTFPTNTLPTNTLWEIFGMAAREDDNIACCNIIKAFYYKSTSIDIIRSRSPAFYEGIPLPYLITLLQGNLRHTHNHSRQAAYKEVGLLDIAERFAEMKKEPHPDEGRDWDM